MMNSLSVKLGFWSALVSLVLFLVFTVCFVGIALSGPLYFWVDLADYVAYVEGTSPFFRELAQATMLLFAPAFVVLLNSLYEYAPREKKPVARLGLIFGSLFTLLSGVHYFVQLTTVRLNVQSGATVGLEHLVQANPNAAILAVNMLGWTLFLGLASLCMVPLFRGGRLEKVIRYGWLVNGIACLVGGVGFVFGWVLVIFVAMNLMVGGALLAVFGGLCVWFRRMDAWGVGRGA